jgi:hypothetical protein
LSLPVGTPRSCGAITRSFTMRWSGCTPRSRRSFRTDKRDLT